MNARIGDLIEVTWDGETVQARIVSVDPHGNHLVDGNPYFGVRLLSQLPDNGRLLPFHRG